MTMPTAAEELDMRWRAYAMTLSAPVWWEQVRQKAVKRGTMCLVKTPEALFGITNWHVLRIYEKHKATKNDIFCQLGSAPFDPSANAIDSSRYWDLATFRIPFLT